MDLLITGSRSWTTYDPHGKAIEQTLVDLVHPEPHANITVHHGGAGGADLMGSLAATRQGMKVREWPANWLEYGPRAGVIRNLQMLRFGPCPNHIIAFWDRFSKDTLHMIGLCLERYGYSVLVVYPWRTEFNEPYFEKEVVDNLFQLTVIANRHKIHEPEPTIVVSTNPEENPWNRKDADAEDQEG